MIANWKCKNTYQIVTGHLAKYLENTKHKNPVSAVTYCM
jgi:hypothetical protein